MEELQKLSQALDDAQVTHRQEKVTLLSEKDQLERKIENQKRSIRYVTMISVGSWPEKQEKVWTCKVLIPGFQKV